MSTRGGSQRDRQTAGRARPGEFHPAAGVTFRFSTGAQAALERVLRPPRGGREATGNRQTPYDLAARLVAAHVGDTVEVHVRRQGGQSGQGGSAHMDETITLGNDSPAGLIGLRLGRLNVRGALAERLPIGSLVASEIEAETTRHRASSGAAIVRTLAAWREVGIVRVHADLLAGGANGADFFVRHLGAEGAIPRELLQVVQARFGRGVSRVEQLMRRPGGPAWWKAHRMSVFDATLDLRPNGRTTRALARYVRRLSG